MRRSCALLGGTEQQQYTIAHSQSNAAEQVSYRTYQKDRYFEINI